MTIIPYLVAYLLIGLVIGACLENLYILFDFTKTVSVLRLVVTALIWPFFVVILAANIYKHIDTREAEK